MLKVNLSESVFGIMETRNKARPFNFQDKFYHDYPSYKKDERRDGRVKIRRSDSSYSRSRDKSHERRSQPKSNRSGSVKRFSSQQNLDKVIQKPGYDANNWNLSQSRNWTVDTGDTWAHRHDDTGERYSRDKNDRRRWGWAGAEFELVSNSNNNNNRKGPPSQHGRRKQVTNDYVDMSSMDTSSSEESSLLAYRRGRRSGYELNEPRQDFESQDQSEYRHGYNKIYTRHPQPVSRSKSINRPSPPRAKSVGYGSSNMGYQGRTHSFTSIYETRSVGAGYVKNGNPIELRPLRTSLSSQGIFFTETGHLPRASANNIQNDHAPLSISLQDLQSSAFTRKSSERMGRSMLDLCNVTINDSEIDKDDALLIISIAKRAVEVCGDMTRPGVHGKVAGLIKDKVEQGLGMGGWQCIVGQKGAFGCCLAPAPNNYFNFDLSSITVLMFKAT